MKIHFELEENELDITPLKVAEALINAGFEVETSALEKTFTKQEKVFVKAFDENELSEIAEYLQVYYKYNKQEEVE